MKKRFLYIVTALIVLFSCKNPILWQNDITTFVEDGFSAVLVRNYSFTARDVQNDMIPSGSEISVIVDIINPRELTVDYTLAWDASESDLFDVVPVIINSGPSEVSISFTPSLEAERRDITLTLGFFAPEINREYLPEDLVIRCNSAPNPAEFQAAVFDGADKSYVRFELPGEVTDDDLASVELEYYPVDESLSPVTENIGLVEEYHPAGVSAGVPYRYHITVIDMEGLRSEPVQAANGDVYQVTYDANGAEGGSVPVDSSFYLAGDEVTVLDNTGGLYLTGHNLAGWNTAADGSGTAYAPNDTFPMPASELTLYAQWSTGDYTLSYSGNGSTGGSAPAGGSYLYGATVTVSDNTGTLVRTGYSFNGWNTASDGSGTPYSPGATLSMPAANVTLYAQWSLLYSVSYNANGATGGSVPFGSSYLSGETVTVSDNYGSLVRTGYSFNGWNTASDGSGTPYSPGETFSMPASNVTLYAQWSINSYTLTYDANGATGGSPPGGGSYIYGSTITVSDNTGGLVRTGHSFNGWNTASDGSGTPYAPGNTFSMPASNVTLYAQWSVNSYTLSYNTNGATGGSPPSGGSYNYGATITVSDNTGGLVRTGYSFTGWNTASDGSGTPYSPGATFAMPASNVTLYAQWNINNYTFSYNGNGATGGSAPAGGSYTYGNEVTVSNTGTLVRTSFIFNKWNTVSDGSGTSYAPADTFNMPASDVTLYAQWTPLYSLTYLSNGATSGTPPASAEYEAATVVTVEYSGDLLRTGNVFSHWNTASDGSGTSWYPGDSLTMPSENVTLYAIWIAGTRYDVGDTGPSGGWVFYDKGYYGDPADDDDWRFMEAAPADIGEYLDWGGYGTATGATGVAIGTGSANTDYIVATLGAGTSYPGPLADDYIAGGNTDWFLPSYNELLEMYNNLYLMGLGNFESTYYWSSTEASATQARSVDFSSGTSYILMKNQSSYSTYVRAARRF